MKEKGKVKQSDKIVILSLLRIIILNVVFSNHKYQKEKLNFSFRKNICNITK